MVVEDEEGRQMWALPAYIYEGALYMWAQMVCYCGVGHVER